MGDGIGDFAFWLAIGGMGIGLFFGPIGTAIGRWIESHAGRGGLKELRSEVAGLDQRLSSLDAVESRLIEVEERLDFAERMLTRGSPQPPQESDTPPEPVSAHG